MSHRLTNNEYMVGKDFHIRPNHQIVPTLGEETKNDGIDRISDLDKCCSILHANNGNLIASLRVSPAPWIRSLVSASKLRNGGKGEHVDVVAFIIPGHAILTFGFSHKGSVSGTLTRGFTSGTFLELAPHQFFHARVEWSCTAGRVFKA